ncbi:hypothetical protein [Halorubrum sp. Atlit-26R]|uniref:hypothetical protein n=1 Tax=Halorubrum sp. Atlit-26R TaxID=2282128 RepID=UPI0011C46804|nr:hypothetical protein [Halorubrum sp. Atlit-26R]
MNERQKVSFEIALTRMSWVIYAGVFWYFIENFSDPAMWVFAFVLVFLMEYRLARWTFELEAEKQDLIDEIREQD